MRRCRTRWRAGTRTRDWGASGRRSRPRRWSRSGGRCGGRRRCAALHRRLDSDGHRRSCFEEIDCSSSSLRRLIRVEPEIIQRAPADRVGVLVLSKGLRAPRQRIGSLNRRPGRAAVPLAVKRAVVWPTGMLRRRVKSDVSYVNSSSQRHSERLNCAI